jgi:hypothetical protein
MRRERERIVEMPKNAELEIETPEEQMVTHR